MSLSLSECFKQCRWSELKIRITFDHVKGIVTIIQTCTVEIQILCKYDDQLAQSDLYMIDQTNNVDVIAELPPSVVIHDMSFDWAGRRLAAACSDKTIKIFLKKGDNWIEESSIKISGASVWKLKWARPEFGIILATCSLDRHIRIYELKRIQKSQTDKNQWISIHNIQQTKSVEDIKFTPSKHMGLCLAIASSDGFVKVLVADDSLKLRQWGSPYSLQVNDLGLNCISWSKNLVKEEECVIAVGCKSIQTSPKKILNGMKVSLEEQPQKIENNNTVAFVNFNRGNEKRELQKIPVPKIKESKSINDISWALMNGRSYYLLAIASDSFLKIFELTIKDNGKQMPILDVIREIKLSDSPGYRLSWNVMGTFLSVSEKKKVKIWKAVMRGVWTQVKQIEE